MTNTHIMVDLETMSTAPNAAIVSIGATTIDRNGTRFFYRVVDLQSCIDVGLDISGDTVMWWLQQSQKARNDITRVDASLRQVLLDFSGYVRSCRDDVCLWGNGSDFDNAILANAYRACGISQPWKFFNNRCFRTLRKLHPDILPPNRLGTYHNALDDAIYQAEHALRIAEAIGGLS